MTTRYRTAFMAPSGFTATASAPKSSKHATSASDRKAAAVASRGPVKGPKEPKTERAGTSEAA